MSDRPLYFLWCDLETTGLDPSKDCILEVAFQLTTSGLGDVPGDIRNHYVSRVTPTWPVVLNEFIFKMHVTNGLLADCADLAMGIESVDDDLVRWLANTLPADRDIVLAGATVHFDLSFIRAKMPALAALLHYRCFDVSTLKAAYRSWVGVDLWPKKNEKHRAMADVEDALSVARFFREQFGKLSNQREEQSQ